MSTQRRQFRLDKNAITLLIQSQSGSLQKALLEAVTNALDAGSSQVRIDLNSKRVIIEDDGRGFQSTKELEDFFECFGFDHTQLDRTVGRFGVGRGQLFNFGTNLWTTNGFTMAIDARNNPYEYDLGAAKKPHKGVKIEIDLYDSLSFSELASVETEFKKLAKYCAIPVLFNGKVVNKNPAQMNWDHETPEAWISLDDSHSIKLYSQGIFVQNIPAYKYGKGGVVVTKMGQAIKQNMARNDTLEKDCPVWKSINKKLSHLAKQNKKESSTRVNEPMRVAMAHSALYGTDWDDIGTLLSEQLFTTTNSRHMRLDRVLSTGYVALGPDKDPAADLLMQRNQAIVLSPRTLSRFEVDTVSELVEKINLAIDRYLGLATSYYQVTENLMKLKSKMASCRFYDSVGKLPMNTDTQIIEIKNSELTSDERIFMRLLRNAIMPAATELVWNHLHPDDQKYWFHFRGADNPNVRTVQLAIIPGASAVTDGRTKVWIDRAHANSFMEGGASGFISAANIIIHELLHDFDSSIGHDHDHDFYQAYHDITLGQRVANIGLSSYRSYLAKGGKASAYEIKAMEKANEFEAEHADERLAALSSKPPRPKMR